jgi:hypothetical protein
MGGENRLAPGVSKFPVMVPREWFKWPASSAAFEQISAYAVGGPMLRDCICVRGSISFSLDNLQFLACAPVYHPI